MQHIFKIILIYMSLLIYLLSSKEDGVLKLVGYTIYSPHSPHLVRKKSSIPKTQDLPKQVSNFEILKTLLGPWGSQPQLPY